MTSSAMELENRYGAKNYSPFPVEICRGSGAVVWDTSGKRYLDFLSGIAAVSQGHCHPKIVAALTEQAQRLTLISRAYYSDAFGPFAEYATRYFGYDRLLMMNTGAEAVETGIKLVRKWGYEVKGIPQNEAKIIFCDGNFHGRTVAAISAATQANPHFGPFVPNFVRIPYDDLEALGQALEDPSVAGFLVEPIQGEGGVVVPREGYLRKAYQLCREANVLFVADEIQTGIGRTGRRLACDYEDVHPDILLLGKALSGGVLPISAVLADDLVMDVLRPGDHGSTFGGNPLACAVAMAALKVIVEEELVERSFEAGEVFRRALEAATGDYFLSVRGKGLLNAVVVDPTKGPAASKLCLHLIEKGLLAKDCRPNVLRFAPPLMIPRAELHEGLEIIRGVLHSPT